jgi:hypothetical protein
MFSPELKHVDDAELDVESAVAIDSSLHDDIADFWEKLQKQAAISQSSSSESRSIPPKPKSESSYVKIVSRYNDYTGASIPPDGSTSSPMFEEPSVSEEHLSPSSPEKEFPPPSRGVGKSRRGRGSWRVKPTF